VTLQNADAQSAPKTSVLRQDDTGWPVVVCLGEALTDLVALSDGLPLNQATDFRKAAGGAPANVAVGLARLGTRVGFIGKLGGDAFGLSLRETLATEGVDVRGCVADPRARTALAFVGPDGNGGRSFLFYHQGMADTLLEPAEVDYELIGHAQIFHFGSVTLAAEPSRAATTSAARIARERGCTVSFDPNVRLELWDSPVLAKDAIVDALGLVDLVKVSSDELTFLTGTSDPAEACRSLRGHGPALALVTLGGDGVYYQSTTSAGQVEGISVVAVDSLGAGDAFMAGFLACLAAWPDLTKVRDDEAMARALRFANAVGAITTMRYGAMSALPTRAQVEELLAAVTY
jgi:fructokinase